MIQQYHYDSSSTSIEPIWSFSYHSNIPVYGNGTKFPKISIVDNRRVKQFYVVPRHGIWYSTACIFIWRRKKKNTIRRVVSLNHHHDWIYNHCKNSWNSSRLAPFGQLSLSAHFMAFGRTQCQLRDQVLQARRRHVGSSRIEGSTSSWQIANHYWWQTYHCRIWSYCWISVVKVRNWFYYRTFTATGFFLNL